jgi:hypothetical protein
MTIRELTQWFGAHPWILLAVFVALPVAAWCLRPLHGPANGGVAPWKYAYSVLVYLACVPGMFSSVLTAYALFFRNENLLDANLLVYVLPIVSMILTLVFVSKNVGFDAVPGFDRLSGLMITIACSFGLALAVHKTRIFVGFFGSIDRLFLLAGAIFALLKWGSYMLFRRADEPAREPPRIPSP